VRHSSALKNYGNAAGYLIAVPTRIIERDVRLGGQFVLATTAASYLGTLNPEQRRAVEHGVTAHGHIGAPLLVIAGAGSGKTNTLAHRVAHLIVSGADPRRILLMTFSRRAASEMSKRVERIARKVLGDRYTISLP
jgi:superfamily I DNA and RNA helicase